MTAQEPVKKARKPRAKPASTRGESTRGGKVIPTTGTSVAPTSTRSPQATPRAPTRVRSAKGGSSSGGKVSGPSRLRIKVRAYEHGVLDGAVKQIIDVAARHNAEVVGPVPLPIDIKKYTVNRAAFIDKDSREQFEMRIHKRMVDILNPEPKVIEALTNIDLPSGVSIDVKMM